MWYCQNPIASSRIWWSACDTISNNVNLYDQDPMWHVGQRRRLLCVTTFVDIASGATVGGELSLAACADAGKSAQAGAEAATTASDPAADCGQGPVRSARDSGAADAGREEPKPVRGPLAEPSDAGGLSGVSGAGEDIGLGFDEPGGTAARPAMRVPEQASEEPRAGTTPTLIPTPILTEDALAEHARHDKAARAKEKEGGAPGGGGEGSMGLRLGFLDPLGVLEKVTDVFSRRVLPLPTTPPDASSSSPPSHGCAAPVLGGGVRDDLSGRPPIDPTGGQEAAREPEEPARAVGHAAGEACGLTLASSRDPTLAEEARASAPLPLPELVAVEPGAQAQPEPARSGPAARPLPLPELIAELPPAEPVTHGREPDADGAGSGLAGPPAAGPAAAAAAGLGCGARAPGGEEQAAGEGSPAPVGPHKRPRGLEEEGGHSPVVVSRYAGFM